VITDLLETNGAYPPMGLDLNKDRDVSLFSSLIDFLSPCLNSLCDDLLVSMLLFTACLEPRADFDPASLIRFRLMRIFGESSASCFLKGLVATCRSCYSCYHNRLVPFMGLVCREVILSETREVLLALT